MAGDTDMTKEEKLIIIDKIILTASSIDYSNGDLMTQCEDDAKSFVRNVIAKDSDWIKRINAIRWSVGIFTSSTPDSAFVNAWNSGKQEFVGVLNSIKTEVELYSNIDPSENCISDKLKSDKIFIVHGKNDAMKLAVARVITQLNLNPIILHEQPNKGRTIIEKFERLSANISFAIVLLSADDLMSDGKHRARQNVILELGYFIAKLGRENVIALYDTSSNEIEIPSDITGVLYEPYDKPDGAWQFELVQELQAAGFPVDANSLI